MSKKKKKNGFILLNIITLILIVSAAITHYYAVEWRVEIDPMVYRKVQVQLMIAVHA